MKGLHFKSKTKKHEVSGNKVPEIKEIVGENGNIGYVSKNFTITPNKQTEKNKTEEPSNVWICWGCGHKNSQDVCVVCGKKKAH